MSWRRFAMLLRTLGPRSLWVHAMSRKPVEPVLLTGEEAERYFRGIR